MVNFCTSSTMYLGVNLFAKWKDLLSHDTYVMLTASAVLPFPLTGQLYCHSMFYPSPINISLFYYYTVCQLYTWRSLCKTPRRKKNLGEKNHDPRGKITEIFADFRRKSFEEKFWLITGHSEQTSKPVVRMKRRAESG